MVMTPFCSPTFLNSCLSPMPLKHASSARLSLFLPCDMSFFSQMQTWTCLTNNASIHFLRQSKLAFAHSNHLHCKNKKSATKGAWFYVMFCRNVPCFCRDVPWNVPTKMRNAFAQAKKSRRRSTLPRSHPRSTIDAKELNFRVRDGIGCGLFANITGKIVELSDRF